MSVLDHTRRVSGRKVAYCSYSAVGSRIGTREANVTVQARACGALSLVAVAVYFCAGDQVWLGHWSSVCAGLRHHHDAVGEMGVTSTNHCSVRFADQDLAQEDQRAYSDVSSVNADKPTTCARSACNNQNSPIVTCCLLAFTMAKC